VPVIDNIDLIASKRANHGTDLWSVEGLYIVHFTSVEVNEDHPWFETIEIWDRDNPPDRDDRLATSRTDSFKPDGRSSLNRRLAVQIPESDLRSLSGGEEDIELYVRVVLSDGAHPGSPAIARNNRGAALGIGLYHAG
jgi:hypothetical protein